MSLNIQTITGVEAGAKFLARIIIEKLKLGKKVLWFATGGSSIALAVEVSKIIKPHAHANLTVTLTDERYGPVGHPDSNWQQLLAKGFDLPQAGLIPVLSGDDSTVTTQKFNTILGEELEGDSYKIGLFGIGADGHTAGILPGGVAVEGREWAYGYTSEKFERITITPKTILKLDEAVVFMQGEEKWPALKNLEKNVDILKQPAQILKKVPTLTIFSDYKV